MWKGDVFWEGAPPLMEVIFGLAETSEGVEGGLFVVRLEAGAVLTSSAY